MLLCISFQCTAVTQIYKKRTVPQIFKKTICITFKAIKTYSLERKTHYQSEYIYQKCKQNYFIVWVPWFTPVVDCCWPFRRFTFCIAWLIGRFVSSPYWLVNNFIICMFYEHPLVWLAKNQSRVIKKLTLISKWNDTFVNTRASTKSAHVNKRKQLDRNFFFVVIKNVIIRNIFLNISYTNMIGL